jgi:hypothetical protein
MLQVDIENRRMPEAKIDGIRGKIKYCPLSRSSELKGSRNERRRWCVTLTGSR